MSVASHGKRNKAKKRTKNRCWYCGDHIPKGEHTLDHVVPKSAGGKGRMDNLVLCCVTCNRKKGALSLEAYRAEHNNGMAFWGEVNGG